MSLFRTILIANRGEIACRVIRTARRLGIHTVAVYSEADAQAMHVHMADTAYPIGPAPARDSYLRTDRILDAARRSGAEAIHPGYGFLSENAEFADACAAAGVVFIGPPAAAIRAMGSKSAAKALMERAGVPLVPGYHGDDQDPALLAQEAARIGYPVLIKASAGGGGKGMRIVTEAAGFPEGLALAKGEAGSSFGDDRMLVERYLTRPRHIEIQVFADTHGQTISLFERDCSIQRRHQKVVEEAPAPGMDPARRAEMGEAACAAARAIGYVGAGTVEFISEGDDFFFVEMNTRLQVEHPVTEMVTGQDLVEWQLRVAAGEPLPPQPALNGHAIEVRIYAEDPARDFMPAIGTITHLRQPAEGPHVRIDTGVRGGDTISVHYDPMIAKLIVWDQDRAAAVRRLSAALAEYEVVGVRTNLDLLRRIAAAPDFAAGALDTGFIARHEASLLSPPGATPAMVPLLAAAAIVQARDAAAHAAARAGADPHSPWSAARSFRLNGEGSESVHLLDQDTPRIAQVRRTPGGLSIAIDDAPATPIALEDGRAQIAGIWHRATVTRHGPDLTVLVDGAAWGLTETDRLQPALTEETGSDRLLAPMPGRVIEVRTAPGALVQKGDVLVVLEAMKVQMRLAAPRDGTVLAVRAAAGELVDDGAELVTFEAG